MLEMMSLIVFAEGIVSEIRFLTISWITPIFFSVPGDGAADKEAVSGHV